MTALAARVLGYGVRALDPDPFCAARAVSDEVLTAPFDDEDAVLQLARAADVLMPEIEQISTRGMSRAAELVPVRPGAAVLEMVQDRARQKEWLRAHGFPVGPYQTVSTPDEFARAVRALNGPSIAKVAAGGYDGRGQASILDPAYAEESWRAIGGRRCVVERRLDLAMEISVCVARRPGGEHAVYPVSLNQHEQQVLAWAVLPAPIEPELARRARELAVEIALALEVEGLLVVELFVAAEGGLLVNELAPRPHNTFHSTELACVTSQFEQAVRAICDLPLGDTTAVRPTAIVNLFGDLWLSDRRPSFEQALAVPGARVHLYGKRPRPGRKMGHLAAVGPTADDAVAALHEAHRRLLGHDPSAEELGATARLRAGNDPEDNE
jgi:5-(carboxyamino)imidazole ribonucleotide synthase